MNDPVTNGRRGLKEQPKVILQRVQLCLIRPHRLIELLHLGLEIISSHGNRLLGLSWTLTSRSKHPSNYGKSTVERHWSKNREQNVSEIAAHPVDLLSTLRNSFSESGRGGIRTHGTVTRTPDFESGAFDQLSHPSV